MDKLNIYGPYFSAKEFSIDDRTDKVVREKLYLLTKFGLNRVRAKFGPVKITSGYRSAAQNEMLKLKGYAASPTSQHIVGEAVDFICTALPRGKTMKHVFDYLKDWWPGQCFYYKKKGHIHFALPRIDLQVKGRLYAIILDK